MVAQRTEVASARGYAQAIRFADVHVRGARVWAVEGAAGHHGAGLVRELSGRGETVIESGRGSRDERRLRTKDDPLDAIRGARAALASETLSLPRSGQRREALRLLLLARRSPIEVRRRRPYDMIVRYGGDEFVCAMPNLSALDARARFDKIAAALTAVNAEHSVTVGLAEADPVTVFKN